VADLDLQHGHRTARLAVPDIGHVEAGSSEIRLAESVMPAGSACRRAPCRSETVSGVR
jgi:hypothetical protein